MLAIPWLCLPAGTCSLEGALYATPSATGAEQFGLRIAQGAVQASEQASGVSWTCRSGRPQALVRPALKVSEAQAGQVDATKHVLPLNLDPGAQEHAARCHSVTSLQTLVLVRSDRIQTLAAQGRRQKPVGPDKKPKAKDWFH